MNAAQLFCIAINALLYKVSVNYKLRLDGSFVIIGTVQQARNYPGMKL